MVRSAFKAKLAGVALLTALMANCSGKTYSTFLQPFDLVFGSRGGATANSADTVDLVSATPMTPTRVKLTFDEPVTLATAETAANYSIKAADGTSIMILAVTRDPFDSKVVYVDTAPQVSGTQYTVTVASIVGVDGSLLGSNNTATFTAPSNADNSGPSINSAQTTAIRTVEMTFSEALDATSAGTTGNYKIYTSSANCNANGATAIAVSTAARSTSNFAKTTLTFAADLSGSTYYVRAAGVKDQWGNIISTTNAVACSPVFAGYVTPTAPSVSSIIAPSSSTVLVTYSTAMDTAVADLLDRTKYTINSCSGGGSLTLPTNGTATTSTTVLFTGVTTTGTVNNGQCSLTVTTGNIKSASSAGGVLMTATGNKGVLNYTTTDTSGPQILSVSPTNRLTVSVVFNEPVGFAAIEANPTDYFSFSPSLSIAAANGAVCSSPAGVTAISTCTLTLSAAMTTQTYTLTTSGVKDVAGNTMSTATNTFTGDGAPYIVAIIPAENGTVYVQWSEAIGNAASVGTGDYTIAGATITAAALYPAGADPSNMVQLTISPVLTSGNTYTLTVNTPTGSVDPTGNPALGTVPNGGTFTAPAATVQPQVSAVNTQSTKTIKVTFNDALDNSTLATGDFTLAGGGLCPTAVTAVSQVAAGVVLLTVTETAAGAATACTLTIGAGNVADLFGNTNAATGAINYTYSGTGAGADTTAPTITGITSTSNTTVVVNFSEPVVDGTGTFTFSPALTGGQSVSCTGSVCTITTPAPGQSGVTYSVTVSGLTDTAGNPIASTTVTFGGTGGSSGTGGTTGSPSVYFASLINPTTLEISFSEAIDLTTSQVTGSYSVTGSQTVSAAVRQGDPTKVRLTLSPGAVGSSTSYTVTATTSITDVAGNALVAPLSTTFFGSGNAPSTAPDLAASSDTGVSNTDNITAPAFPSPGLVFTGTVAPNTTVVLYDGGVPVATVTSDSSGNYTLTVTTAPSAGNHSYTVGTVSTSGVASDPSPAIIVTYNTTAPGTPSAAIDLAAASDTGTSSTDNITKTTTGLDFTGSGGVANSIVRLYAGATEIGSATADGSGNWSVKTTVTLAEGANTITYKIESVSGVLSAASTSTLSVTLDTAASAATGTPDLTVGTDTGSSNTDNVTSSTTPAFTVACVNGESVQLYDNGVATGTAVTCAGGTATVTAGTLASGSHTITAVQTDPAGNSSVASSGLSLTIDSTVPATPAAAPALASADDTGTTGDGITSATTALTFTGTVEANATVNIYDNGVLVTSTTADASGNYSVDISLTAGSTHPITVKAQDASGNLSAASAITNVTVDNTAPTTPAAAPALTAGTNTGISNSDGITNLTSGLAFSAGAGAVENNATVQLYDGGTLVATVTAAADGSYSFTGVALTAGAHSLTIKAVDAANNTSAASPALALTIDSTAPAINSSTVIGSNAYIDVVFAEGVYGSATAASALSSPGAFNISLVAGGVTAASILSIKKPDGATSGAASALTGGETTVRVFLTLTGTANGTETVTLTAAGTSIYDSAGNVSSATTGAKSLNATGTANIQSASYTANGSTTGYVHITFTEAAYTTTPFAGALVIADFAATLPTTGNATTVTIDCVRVSTATGCGDAAPAAGDQQVRVFVSFNNAPNGSETLTIAPATSTSIYSNTNNATPTSSTTGALALTDKLAPAITSTAPATNASVKTTTVSYTVSEACVADAVNSTVTWTRTGGTADAGSPRVQALTGSELSTGAHNNITLTNNPALVSGTIYTISFSCKDAAGNISTVVSNTGVTYDTTAPVISAVAPASSTSRNSAVVSYTLSEAIASGSIVWTWTGGTADGGSPRTAALAGTELNTGAHTAITLTNAPTLVDGAIYTVTFNATDAAGNAATTVTSTSVTYDTTLPVISSTAPATNASIKTTAVSFTFSEACASGAGSKVTFTRTGGSADAGSPWAQQLVGTELNSGAHTAITLSNNPTLVNGTIYTVEFNCTDAAGNVATTISNTNVTFDTTAPVFSALAPASSSYRNSTVLSYTLSEAIASGTVTFTRTGGTADPASPQVMSLTGTELTTGAHSSITLTNAPTLVSGAIYTITFNGTDAAGNTATATSVTTVTYDTAAPTAPASVTVPTYTTTTGTSVTIGTLGTDAISFNTHNVKMCTSNDCATGCVGATTSATSPVAVTGLTNGTAYYACVQSVDSATNTSSFVASAATVTVDTSAPVFSSVTPATSANITASDVAYTLSENISSGTITWTRTGGTGTDPSAPHTYTLTGTQLQAGARSISAPVTLSADNTYTVSFSGTDAAGNTGSLNSTGVSYTVSGTFTITSAETMDCNLDGHIDHYKITFNNAITDSTFDGYTGTSNYGNSVDTEWIITDPSLGQYVNVRFSPPAKTNADCSGVTDTADDAVAYLIFNQKAAFDTGVKPDITGSSTVVKKTSGLTRLYTDTGTWASAAVTETDKAGPVVIAAVANEGGAAELGLNVGDTLVISFSEAMTAYDLQGNSVDLDTVFTIAGTNTKFAAFADHNSIAWGSGNTQLTVTFQNANATVAVGDSIKAINPAYANLTDTASNLAGNMTSGLPVITGTFDSGNKGPVITAVEYKDTNHNGYIDHVKVTFDVAVDATTFPGYVATSLGTVTTDWQIAGYSNLRLDTRTTIDSTTSEGDASDSDTVIWIGFAEGSDPDTGSKPDLTATTGSVGLRGTVGVGACYLYTAPAACSTAASGSLLSTAFTAEADKALPVIVTATGTVGSTSLFVSFSEPVWSVTGTPPTGNIAATDFTYDNDSGANVASISSMGSDADGSVDGFVILTMNTTYALADFSSDKLGANGAAAIYDAANQAMLAGNTGTNANEATILEATKPYLMTASSYYNTGTSKYYLRVLFSEAVNSTALTAANYTLATLASCTPAVTGNPSSVTQVGGTRRIYDLETTSQSGTCVYQITGSSSIVDVNEGAPLTLPNIVTTYGTASGDVTKPRILLATATSLNTVLLSYSEPMKTGDVAGSAECKASGNGYTTSLCDSDMDTSVAGNQYRYDFAPTLGTVSSVLQASNTSEFILTHTATQTGSYYTATVYNTATATTTRVSDATGNVMDVTPNNLASFRGMGSAINSFADGPMFQNPFADGTTFSFAFNYSGKVYLGPNDYNSGAFRFEADGLNPVTVSFVGPASGASCLNQTSFGTTGLTVTTLSGTAAVTKGNATITGTGSSYVTEGMGSGSYVNIQGVVYKVSAATATSLTLDTVGYSGSTASGLTIYKQTYTDPASCTVAPLYGPNQEKGLVGFNSGILTGLSNLEILTAGPLKQNVGYSYFTQDIDSQLNWVACPMPSFTGGANTASANLQYTFGDSYYVGMASKHGIQAPFLIRQQLINSSGTLSCQTAGSTAELGVNGVKPLGKAAAGDNPATSGATVGIDSMIYIPAGGGPTPTDTFYIANNGGMNYSTGAPTSSASFNSAGLNGGVGNPILDNTYLGTTNGPTLVLPYGNPSDTNVGGLGKIRPGQKGVPFLTVYKNVMYMARNLGQSQTSVLETVNNGAELWKCSANCTTQTNWKKALTISNFSGGANNLAISVLTVNGGALYVGLDNTIDGVRIFRTTVSEIDSDNSGNDGHNDFVQQTTAGLTNPINFKYFFSSTSMTKGSYSYIYVTVMDGKNAINVARQVD